MDRRDERGRIAAALRDMVREGEQVEHGERLTLDVVGGYEVLANVPEVVRERFHRDGPVLTGAGVSASIDAGLFLAGLIAGEHVARLVQLGIEYFPAPPAFARACLADVPDGDEELLLAFESGPAMERLKTAELPWADLYLKAGEFSAHGAVLPLARELIAIHVAETTGKLVAVHGFGGKGHGDVVGDLHGSHEHRVGLDAELALADLGLRRHSPRIAEGLHPHFDHTPRGSAVDLQRAVESIALACRSDVVGVKPDVWKTCCLKDFDRIGTYQPLLRARERRHSAFSVEHLKRIDIDRQLRRAGFASVPPHRGMPAVHLDRQAVAHPRGSARDRGTDQQFAVGCVQCL